MIRSMTGYGEAARTLEDGVLRVEIKTVNHRFLNVSLRTPSGFDRVEHEIQAWLRPFFARGHVNLVVSLERAGTGSDGALPQLDMERARHYVSLLRRLSVELDLPGGPDLSALARFGDIFRSPEVGSRSELPVDADVLRELVGEAAGAVVALRETEGRRLAADMEERLRALEQDLERVAARAPERLIRERDRLRAAIKELAGQEDVDGDRLAREVAYLAERWDVNEELVRFRSHIELFRETLASEGSEGVGKRLSFVVQELHREANTIGSKANDTEIARAGLALKEDIERLREQVENVE